MAKQNVDIQYMQLALTLAEKGVGATEPNPAVGCVIVKRNKIIGQGYHKRFGAAHAEVEAIADCRSNGSSTKNATMYVTLEPCSHYGKTPPCSKAVIAAGIKKIFIAAKDPSPHVAGNGIAQLRHAGIEVIVGTCARQAKYLNRWFFHYALTKRPWVICKWAQSIDGKLAYKDAAANGQWISNPQSRKDVHALRRQCQAIITGVSTVIADDPLLTPRPAKGKHPLRIVLDSALRIPLDAKLLLPAKSKTLIVTTARSVKAGRRKADALAKMGANVLPLTSSKKRCDISELLTHLGSIGIQQLLVEAGPTLQTAFLKGTHANELQIYIAPKILAADGTASISKAMKTKLPAMQLNQTKIHQFNTDTKITGLI